ncbi:MAG TPA: lysine--tRNA ligase [bacterium]|nr:lysine--tRNA ligase [bacterium]
MADENFNPGIDTNDEELIRLKKLRDLEKLGVQTYPERYDKDCSLKDTFELAEGEKVKTAGRLVLIRDMGKLCFAHIQDYSGRYQIAFKADEVGKDKYDFFVKHFDLGDFIGVEGELFVTHKGEKTILVKDFMFLGKALKPLPGKFHGLQDQEVKYRQRYLDLISDQETMNRFLFRSKFIKAIREFYWKEGFQEVETSTLLHSPTGANARPYITHNNGLDIDVYLRISHELPLKELIVGGFEKIFELGKAFRNEGFDPSHLPEHTHLEHYCAYWNFEDNIKFTEKMFDYLFDTLNLPRKMSIQGKDGEFREVDFTTPWPRVSFVELIKKDTGIDLNEVKTVEELRKIIAKKGIEIEESDKMSYSTLVDYIYKKVSRPKLLGPIFLYEYPVELQPLARRNDKNPVMVDQFQMVINGWELVKAYSELVDPLDQEERFKEQAQAQAEGDEEAMYGDDEFIDCMKYGMPPISGWGMGVDRILTLLTGQSNLRDVVLFPLMRPKSQNQENNQDKE